MARPALLALLMTTCRPAAPQAEDVGTEVLERINHYREIVAVGAVTLDAALAKGCAAHAQYVALNPTAAADDGDPKLPGYSEEGRRAAKSSFVAWREPVAAIDVWMATLFHRLPVIAPELKSIGIGAARTSKGDCVVVLDVRSGIAAVKREAAVVYPAVRQRDVPLAFGGEQPSPIPGDEDGQAGYPVTVTWPDGTPVRDVVASMRDAQGRDVAVWLSTPEKPADGRRQGNTVCLIAKDVFAPGTKYTVKITAKVGDKTLPWEWSFTTRAR